MKIRTISLLVLLGMAATVPAPASPENGKVAGIDEGEDALPGKATGHHLRISSGYRLDREPTRVDRAILLLPLDLYDTGVDYFGEILEDRERDPHWILEESADSLHAGPAAYTAASDEFPIPPWVPNGPESKWITPRPDGTTVAAGEYVYRTVFDLGDFDPATTYINGQVAVDNSLDDILINGAGSGITHQSFENWGYFTISNLFTGGVNILEFRMSNWGEEANPSGFRVEMHLQRGLGNFPTALSAGPGWDIFTPKWWQDYAYRYGPSIIINEDDSVDIWLAALGGEGAWDWIRHKRSRDGGRTWGPETVVLKPTPGSEDRYSICDPGVIRFGGYYYLGYTSVDNEQGWNNNAFVARSTSPTEGFEKWNGSGWGGDPRPFIEYEGPPDAWGAGEPSFVLKDGTLYIYYTWDSQTRVATAPASDPDWPGRLTFHGVAVPRVDGEDSTDLKYVDVLQKFIGIAVAERFLDTCYIIMWESADGINFTIADEIRDNIRECAHNAGISGTPIGHIDMNDDNFVSYAYSRDCEGIWGWWHTHLNPVSFSEDDPPLSLSGWCVTGR